MRRVARVRLVCMVAAVRCRKCGETIKLDFGNLGYNEALEAVDRMDCQPGECPGFHVELAGWRKLWQMDLALAIVFPEHRGEYERKLKDGSLFLYPPGEYGPPDPLPDMVAGADESLFPVLDCERRE